MSRSLQVIGILIVLISIAGVASAAISVGNIVMSPSGDLVSGQTQSSASYTVNFGSSGGYTFDNSNTLQMETELAEATWSYNIILGGHLPTSIHGLSPDSPFLRVLGDNKPTVPTHSILGARGRGDLANSSDGVVPFSSAHFPTAESEVVVPTGHRGFTHPDAVAELKRILKLEPAAARKPAARKGRVRK